MKRCVVGAIVAWVPLAAGLTAVALIVYAAVQQDIRQSANNPQIELAESAASRLEGGVSASQLVPSVPVDMSASLSPFLIVYDEKGAVQASSASLHGRTPRLPVGVLDSLNTDSHALSLWGVGITVASALLHGEKPRILRDMPGGMGRKGQARFTWEPEPGVRAAAVMTAFDGQTQGFVLAGRSLREVERLEDHIVLLVLAGLIGGLVVTLVIALAAAAIQASLRT